jgi:acetyltransferase-like isoleucine patch superfamily enzyme
MNISIPKILRSMLGKGKRLIHGKIRGILHPSIPWDTVVHKPYRIDGEEGLSVGNSVKFQSGVWLFCDRTVGTFTKLEIGDNCSFGYRNHIACVGEIIIGDNVLTANNVYISDNLHNYEDTKRPIMDQPVTFTRKVEIGSGSWIGENACVIGAKVGKNSVIGANSVVTRDIPDYCVAVGIPARVIRKYNEEKKEWEKC